MMQAVLTGAMMIAGAGVGADTPDVRAVVYDCARGVTVPVTYIDAAGLDGVAVIHVEGQQVVMRQFQSGSGTKYADFDEQRGYRWWVKGDAAVLSNLAADHTAEERVLLDDCIIAVR